MADPNNGPDRVDLMLLQEYFWKLEEKLEVFVESLADLEAETIRLKRGVKLVEQRLESLERNRCHRQTQERIHGR